MTKELKALKKPEKQHCGKTYKCNECPYRDACEVHERNQVINEYEAFLRYLKQLVIEDVPHKYQDRLLETLK